MKDEIKQYFEANKQRWDKVTPTHIESDFYDNKAFLEGKSTLTAIESPFLDNIKGKKVLHIQCHFGQDSITMARMGAKVTATDFSPVALEAARTFANQVGVEVNFIEANTLNIDKILNEKFDLIFLTYGVISWLPDINELARICSQLIAPGGRLLMAEFHPTLYLFDFDTKEIAYPYFNSGVFSDDAAGDYTDFERKETGKEYFWCHSISEVMTGLINNGFKIKTFKEYDYSPYPCFPNMKEIEAGKYVFGDFKYPLPHIFLVEAII